MVERENTNQEVEFRKIQYSGKSSFTIALPKKWVTNQKLNAGDRLSVRSDSSNNLILSTNKNSKEKKRAKIVIDQSDNKGQIERKIIERALIDFTRLPKKKIEEILNLAEKKEQDSNQILEFTQEIKKNNMKFRLQIIELLWKIIYSDGIADQYETNLIRRVCGLLYISDKDNGDIKLKIKNQ